MIYICYGAKKAGSTLAYYLTRAVVEAAGHPHLALPAELRQDEQGHAGIVNTVRDWNAAVVGMIDKAVSPQRIVTFRTHHGPGRRPTAIQPLIAAGRAKVQVALRDPRDLALSMRDVVTRLRDMGKPRRGSQLESLDEMMHHIGRNLAFATEWANMPGALVVDYEDTAFRAERTCAAVVEHLGLDLAPTCFPALIDDVNAPENNARNKKRKAMSRRHRHEMPAEEQALFLARFAAFYERFMPDAQVDVEGDASRDAEGRVATL